MDNKKIVEISGTLLTRSKKAEFLEMRGVRDNMEISVDCLSMNIIRHLWLYFQCWLIQSILKLETNIEFSKLREASNSNQKPEN